MIGEKANNIKPTMIKNIAVPIFLVFYISLQMRYSSLHKFSHLQQSEIELLIHCYLLRILYRLVWRPFSVL